MEIIALVEDRHQPIPDNINVLQEFGPEKVVVTDGPNIKECIRGTAMYLQGDARDFYDWLAKHKGIWTSNNPIVGDWTFEQVSRL